MGKFIAKIFKSTITLGIIYLALGISLVLFPVQAINISCKIIFGIVLIGVGLYHVIYFAMEKKGTTILDLFSGVIVLVLGIFLFYNPQIVVKLLQYMLGAFILGDSIWTLIGTIKLAKRKRWEWKILLVGSLVFVALGIAIVINPFDQLSKTIIFSGWVFVANGIEDILLFVLFRHGIKKSEKKMCDAELKSSNDVETNPVSEEQHKDKADQAQDEIAENIEKSVQEEIKEWKD